MGYVEGGFMVVYKKRDLDDRWRGAGNTWPDVCALLCYWAGDCRTLHFTLVVDNNTCVVFEVDEHTVLSSNGLTLTDDDARPAKRA